ncbi:MAG: hypothetical protein IPM29_05145 [Planctomycetes bacterium]|nr:hypothetical protein [Planctomycetota bacterium]
MRSAVLAILFLTLGLCGTAAAQGPTNLYLVSPGGYIGPFQNTTGNPVGAVLEVGLGNGDYVVVSVDGVSPLGWWWLAVASNAPCGLMLRLTFYEFFPNGQYTLHGPAYYRIDC